MVITNQFGVPEPLVTLASRQFYTKGKAQYSVTEIMAPPKIKRLRERFDGQIKQDVSDMLWNLLGSALHVVMERGDTDGWVMEERIFCEVDGVTISGAIDLQQETPEGIVLIDYKFTSAWALMNDKPEWEQQQNIYKYLVERVKQRPVKGLKICALIRDWSRRDAALKPGYPDAPIKVIPVQLWPMEQREAFILGKIKEHSNALFDLETGDELPFCTPDQTWEKPTTYAVKKIGNVKARNVCNTDEEAQAKVAEYGKDYEIIVRQGERTRCAEFCSVSRFCNQYQEYLSTKETL